MTISAALSELRQLPGNEPQEYDGISPNLRYYVVLSNGDDGQEQAWEIQLD